MLLLGSVIGPEVGEAEAFRLWLDELRREAGERGISERTLDAALNRVERIERVIELDRDQPEFKLSFGDYLARVVTDSRVRKGRDRLYEHRELLGRVRDRYGVQPRFVVALWGVETDYGRITGGIRRIDAM